jgi:pSer/pThr/pTyr-binding forkhead associated (FHA) protein
METHVAPDESDLTERIVPEQEEGDDSTERIDVSCCAKLIRLEPEGEPREIRLVPGRFVVGRPARSTAPGGTGADILIHHRSVSRKHAELYCVIDENGDPLVTVCDLGSANGTIHNNRHIGSQPVEMNWDDEIVFGEVRYRLRIQQRFY